MKLLFPLLPSPMTMVDDKINILVIENKKVFYEFLTGLYEQCYKNTGSIVLSKDEKELDIAKNLELILQLVPFESNRKTLVTKLQSHLNSVAVNEYYVSVCDIQSRIEKFLLELNDVSNCNITYDEPSILTILKAMNTRFNDDYESLCEALIVNGKPLVPCNNFAEHVARRFAFRILVCFCNCPADLQTMASRTADKCLVHLHREAGFVREEIAYILPVSDC